MLAVTGLEIASGLLTEGSTNLARVANEIGYESEAASAEPSKRWLACRLRSGAAASAPRTDSATCLSSCSSGEIVDVGVGPKAPLVGKGIVDQAIGAGEGEASG